MDVMATHDKSKQPGPYGGPAPPGVHHQMHPSEVSHGQPPPPQPQQPHPPPPHQQGVYDPWRRYPPYEEANPDQRQQQHPQHHPQQQHPQPPPPTQPQHGPHHPPPAPPPPQHPPGVPYAHHGAVSGPPPSPPNVPHAQHQNYRPVNGTTHEPAPHPPPGDYRQRVGYPPHEAHPNSEIPPAGHPVHHPEAIHQHPQPMAGQYAPTNTPHSHTPGTYDPGGYFHNQPGGPYRQQPQQPPPPQQPQQQHQQQQHQHSQSSGGRRTGRAQQACDQCRARKAKCDEGRPACSNCKEHTLGCVYKEVPPHKQEKATQALMERLDRLDERFSAVEEIQEILKSHGEHIKTLVSAQQSSQPPSKVARTSASQKSPSSDSISNERRFVTDQTSKKPLNDNTSNSFSSTIQGDEEVDDDAAHGSKLAQQDDGELSIPIEHTTAAHKLLLWPSIQKLLGGKWGDDYVMTLEERRGLIRVYGQGEGDDRSDSARGPDSPMTDSPSSQADNDPSQAFSPSALWGTVFTPYAGMERPRSPRAQVGGLNSMGYLNTDAAIIHQYHQSYMNNMHILHPFLDLKDLNTMINEFTQKYSPPRKKTFTAPFIPSNNAGSPPYHRASKRKRSSETLHNSVAEAGSSPNSSASGISVAPVARTIGNATVLLVLALGAICEYKDVLPGPIQDPNTDSQKSFNTPNPPQAGLSPANSDPGIPSGAYPPNNAFSSVPGDSRTTLGRSYSTGGYHESSDSSLKNMDVIPGMAYFAYATDILGNLQGGNRLSHVHACLLAGLYTGQLAHPFASHGWIYQASRACQVLVRPRRYQKMKDGSYLDMINFAYWTCLQLESDILAELDLPASGISRSESRIKFPKGVFTHELPHELNAPNTMMMFHYTAQIHLRKALNQVHTDLYKAEKLGSEDPQTKWSTSIQKILSYNLELWRQNLPPMMRWEDDDPPADDINTARMRAKYYGARYIIHRPLLHHALHPIPPPKETSSALAESPASAGSRSQQVSPSLAHNHRVSSMVRRSSEMGPPGSNLPYQNQKAIPFKKLDPKLQEACEICIDAAMRSTTAFDGVKGRPIVTNIFGTAHAQFGNLLVLSATYMSNLSELVDREKLRVLLQRTIAFLHKSRNISPTLRCDADILTEIYQKIFDDNATSSFSQ